MKKLLLFFAISFVIVGVLLVLQHRGIINWRVPLPQLSWSKKHDNTDALRVAFMDIGQGDATLLQFPGGQTMLVDCGPDASILSALGRNLAWNQRDLDYLVVTHAHADHFGGCIDVLARFRVHTIFYSGYDGEASSLLRDWHRAVTEEQQAEGAEFKIMNTPNTMVVGSSTIRFLYPDHDVVIDPHVPGETALNVNDTSVVIKVTYGTQDILLTGDMEAPLEHYLISKIGSELAAEILKAGHHGSRSSSSEEFLRAVQPKEVVISSGQGNSYDHPHRNILYRLADFGVTTWRTDTGGDILATLSTSTYAIQFASGLGH